MGGQISARRRARELWEQDERERQAAEEAARAAESDKDGKEGSDEKKQNDGDATVAAAASSSSSSSSSSVSSSSPSPADDPAPLANSAGVDYTDLPGQPLPFASSGEVALNIWDRGKTFKPQRVVPEDAGGGVGQRLMMTIQATMRQTLGAGDLEQAVKCPQGEDINEWLAVNTVNFFNAASLIFGTVSQYCTRSSCPIMAAGKAEYLWRDTNNPLYQKPTRLPAPDYIDLMMTDIDATITDPDIFPVDNDARFPRNFLSIIRNIYKRLFRLYAHLYCAHHDRIRAIGASAHLNTSFKHLIYFIRQHQLVTQTEMQPLDKLIQKLLQNQQQQQQQQ